LIRERQREGIAIAKREGKYTGRKFSLMPARAAELRRRVADGASKATLAREFGISRDTLYRYVPVKKRRGRRARFLQEARASPYGFEASGLIP